MVPTNKKLSVGTVPMNNFLFVGTVPMNNFFVIRFGSWRQKTYTYKKDNK